MKRLIKVCVPLFIIVTITIVSFAMSNVRLVDDTTFEMTSKEKKISSNFDKDIEITINNNDENYELKQNITELTKKTTFLLLGEANKQDESAENYFKRRQDYLNLRYNPEIPKDEKSLIGLDEQSEEYSDDILSGMVVPGMFNKLNELDVTYNTYENIRVSIINDKMVTSAITLPEITIKKQNEADPMKYDYVKGNLTIYYIYKKIRNEYKLLYLYGETDDSIEKYIGNSTDEGSNEETAFKLEKIYNFSKAKAVTDGMLNEIYNKNKSKLVFLNSVYNTGTITTANGFFISDGIIVTTYNFIEKSLMDAQKIIISDYFGSIYKLEGIVTINVEKDIAILKVENKNLNSIEIESIDKVKQEDAVIALNSQDGFNLATLKGIVISNDGNIETSIQITEENQGSPIFNADGKLIGMINSKAIDESVSFATNLDILKEYWEKITSKEYDEIKCVSFNELKENYYIKYNDEEVVNNIPQKKWEEYSKAENADETIKLKLIKSSYKDGIISLRYKNDVEGYIDTMQFASEYIENLENKGYKEVNNSDSKVIYENGKYKIVIMKEFDYLIIVMVKL